LNRIKGDIFADPGPFSLSIAYFDTNDFYFSGHIGSCTMYMTEMFALGHSRIGYIYMAILVFQWIFLTIVRTHYVIDLIYGIIVALTLHRTGEILCYLLDYLVMKLQLKNRGSYWYKPCKKCGWCVDNADLLVSKQEREWQQ